MSPKYAQRRSGPTRRTTDVDVDARRPLTNAQIRTIATWRIGRKEASSPTGVARREARRLATTVLYQTRQLEATMP